MSQHSQLVGLELHQPYHYVQEADPGAIGARLFWLQISTGSVRLRNEANDGWTNVSAASLVDSFVDLDDVPSSYVGETGKIVAVNGAENALEFINLPATVIPDWIEDVPDKPPASPNAKDDEFNAGSLDGKWTWNNQGTATASFSVDSIQLRALANSTASVKSIRQALPATPYTITAKFDYFCRTNPAFFKAGLLLSDGTKITSLGFANNTSLEISDTKFNNSTSGGVGVTNNVTLVLTQLPGKFPTYFRITDNGTTLTYDFSFDGGFWYQLTNISRTNFFPSGPTHFGLCMDSQNSAHDVYLRCNWIRVT
jgi:hypothetical protein